MSKFTFALLKPDVSNTPQEKEILKLLKENGFLVAGKKLIKCPAPHIVATHLEALRTRIPEAFDRNFLYLAQGPVTALHIAHKDPEVDPIQALRTLAGPTDPSKAPKGTLRQIFGQDTIRKATREKRGLRNAIHCSDCPEAAHEEYMLWFYGETHTVPKHEFLLQDNNDGDEISLQFLPGSQIQLNVAQCCVHRFKGEIPVSLLIDILVLWKNGQHQSSWAHPHLWPALKDRIKVQTL